MAPSGECFLTLTQPCDLAAIEDVHTVRVEPFVAFVSLLRFFLFFLLVAVAAGVVVLVGIAAAAAAAAAFITGTGESTFHCAVLAYVLVSAQCLDVLMSSISCLWT